MKPSVVFFGSGPVAAKSLALLAESFAIETVITKPRPSGHHGAVPVLELADKLNLPVITATNKHELTEKVLGSRFKDRVAVLIDFGIIIEQAVIDTFPLGIVNSHFSLLPEWRGADPITFAILSGQPKTGVSLMLLNDKMDEGPLLAIGEYDLPKDITTPELTEDLISLSYALIKDMLPEYMAGQIKPTTQESAATLIGYSPKASYSRKLTKQDGIIDWAKPAQQIEREIRAFIEWPKSRTRLSDIDVIITKSHVTTPYPNSGFGVVTFTANIGELAVSCGEGRLQIDQLKPVGKREMSAKEFLIGYRNRLSK